MIYCTLSRNLLKKNSKELSVNPCILRMLKQKMCKERVRRESLPILE
jgi:hypothetical protein